MATTAMDPTVNDTMTQIQLRLLRQVSVYVANRIEEKRREVKRMSNNTRQQKHHTVER